MLVQDTKTKRVIPVHIMKGDEPEAYSMTTTLKSSDFMNGVYAVSGDFFVKARDHYSVLMTGGFGNLFVIILGWPTVIAVTILRYLHRKK
jgi:hypothetical protein